MTIWSAPPNPYFWHRKSNDIICMDFDLSRRSSMSSTHILRFFPPLDFPESETRGGKPKTGRRPKKNWDFWGRVYVENHLRNVFLKGFRHFEDVNFQNFRLQRFCNLKIFTCSTFGTSKRFKNGVSSPPQAEIFWGFWRSWVDPLTRSTIHRFTTPTAHSRLCRINHR